MSGVAAAIAGSAILGAVTAKKNRSEVSYVPESALQTQISELLKQYLQTYGGQMTGRTPVPTYTGQLTAGLSPLQTQSISNISGLQNLGQSNDVLSQIMNMVSGKNFDPSYMRNAYQTGVEDPLKRTFTETTMPALNSAYSKAGLFYGSDRGEATRKESQTLMDALSMGRSNLESNIYTAGLANQQQGISDFSTWLSDQGGLSQLGMLGGLQEQQTEQAKLTADYNQWLRTQAGSMPTDQLLQAILGMYPGTAQQSIVKPADTSTQDMLGNLLMAFAMYKGGKT